MKIGSIAVSPRAFLGPLLICIAITGILTLYVSYSVKAVGNIHSKGGESSVWVIGQIEPQAIHFERDLQALIAGQDIQTPVPGMLMSAEILLSRMDVVDAHISGEQITLQPEAQLLWLRIKLYEPLIEAIADSFGTDDFRPSVEAFYANGSFIEEVRAFSVDAMHSAVMESATQRQALTGFVEYSLIILGCFTALLAFGLVATYRSFQQARKNKLQAQQQKSIFQSICNLSIEGIVAVNLGNDESFVNSAFRRMFGLNEDETPSKDCLVSLLSPKDSNSDSKIDWALYNSNAKLGNREYTILYREVLTQSRDGRDIWIDVHLSSIRSTGDQITLFYIKDRTEEKLSTEKLRLAMQDAIDANEDKAKFLSTMSHEMRTPINSVIASLDYVQSRFDIHGDMKKPLSLAERCAKLALEQISNVLDLSALERQEALSSDTVFNITKEITELVEKFTPLADINKTSIVLELPEFETAFVKCSSKTLMRPINNLLSNAVKFTKNGTIQVRAAINSGMLRIDVEDDGPGLPCDVIENVFTPYVKSGDRFSVANDGSGLGLSIAKRAVDVLGGQIDFHTAPGIGSHFWFEVPVAHQAHDTKATPVSMSRGKPNVETRKILLAEDDEATREITVDMLTWFGQDITVVSDGSEAIERAKETAFDIILMDVNMPKVSGVDATRAIRSEGASKASKIYGVTAFQSKDDVEHIRSSGMDKVLPKPLTSVALRTLLNVNHAVKPEQRIVHKKVIQEAVKKLVSDWRDLFKKVQSKDYCLTDETYKELHKLKGGFLLVEMSEPADYIRQIETMDQSETKQIKALFASVNRVLNL